MGLINGTDLFPGLGAAPQDEGVGLADYGRALKSGSESFVSSGFGAGEWFRDLFSDPKPGEDPSWLTTQRQEWDAAADRTVEGMSPAARKAITSQFLVAPSDENSVFQNLDASLALKLVQNIPSLAASLLVGAATGGVGAAAGAGEGAITAAQMAGAGLTEGLQSAGSVYSSISKELEGMDDAKLQKVSPFYANLRATGNDEQTARQETIKNAGLLYAGISGVFSGVTGAIGDNVILKMFGGHAPASLVGRVAEGARAEGLTEFAQSGAEAGLTQAGMNTATGRPYDPVNIAEQAVEGGIVGAGGGGAVSGLARPRNTIVTPDQDAALGAHGAGTPQQDAPGAPPASNIPVTQPPGGLFNPDPNQGELFTDYRRQAIPTGPGGPEPEQLGLGLPDPRQSGLPLQGAAPQGVGPTLPPPLQPRQAIPTEPTGPDPRRLIGAPPEPGTPGYSMFRDEGTTGYARPDGRPAAAPDVPDQQVPELVQRFRAGEQLTHEELAHVITGGMTIAVRNRLGEPQPEQVRRGPAIAVTDHGVNPDTGGNRISYGIQEPGKVVATIMPEGIQALQRVAHALITYAGQGANPVEQTVHGLNNISAEAQSTVIGQDDAGRPVRLGEVLHDLMGLLTGKPVLVDKGTPGSAAPRSVSGVGQSGTVLTDDSISTSAGNEPVLPRLNDAQRGAVERSTGMKFQRLVTSFRNNVIPGRTIENNDGLRDKLRDIVRGTIRALNGAYERQSQDNIGEDAAAHAQMAEAEFKALSGRLFDALRGIDKVQETGLAHAGGAHGLAEKIASVAGVINEFLGNTGSVGDNPMGAVANGDTGVLDKLHAAAQRFAKTKLQGDGPGQDLPDNPAKKDVREPSAVTKRLADRAEKLATPPGAEKAKKAAANRLTRAIRQGVTSHDELSDQAAAAVKEIADLKAENARVRRQAKKAEQAIMVSKVREQAAKERAAAAEQRAKEAENKPAPAPAEPKVATRSKAPKAEKVKATADEKSAAKIMALPDEVRADLITNYGQFVVNGDEASGRAAKALAKEHGITDADFKWLQRGITEFLNNEASDVTDESPAGRVQEAPPVASPKVSKAERAKSVSRGKSTGGNSTRPSKADAGAVRGNGSGRERPRLQVFDGEALPEPGNFVSARGYKSFPGDTQIEGVNRVLSRFLEPNGKPTEDANRKGFLLADGTGVGKTAQEIMVAVEMAKRTGKPALIVTQNQEIIDNFSHDGEAMGVDLEKSNVQVVTYTALTSEGGKSIRLGKYGVVVFDEAHNLKNVQSQRAQTAAGLTTDFVVYATGTPADRPTATAYFMSLITGRTEEAVAKELGFKYVTIERTGTEPVTMIQTLPGHTWEIVQKNMVEMRQKAVKDGAMLRREYPFWGELADVEITLAKAAMAEYQKIWDHYQELADASGKGGAMKWIGQRTQELGRWMEHYKLDAALKEMDAALARGDQVIIVAETVNEQKLKGLGTPRAGSMETLTAALDKRGIKVASIYGKAAKGAKGREIERFQNGEAKVALISPQSGGTGINLDDSKGDAPRTMIVLTKNFSGDVFEQLLGRVSRRNTQSPSTIKFIVATNAQSESRRADLVNQRLEALKAIQRGQTGTADELRTKAAVETEGLKTPANVDEQGNVKRGRPKKTKDLFEVSRRTLLGALAGAVGAGAIAKLPIFTDDGVSPLPKPADALAAGQAARTERVLTQSNGIVTTMLNKAEKAGTGVPLHDLLNAIKDKLPTEDTRALAVALLAKAPNLTVYSGDTPITLPDGRERMASKINAFGITFTSKGQPLAIALDLSKYGQESNYIGTTSPAMTLLHEALHAASVARMKKLDNSPKHRLNEMRNRIFNAFEQAAVDQFPTGLLVRKEMPYWLQGAIANPDEMLAYAFTDARVQGFMQSISFSQSRIEGLRPIEGTVWGNFVGWVKNLLGLTTRGNVLDAALRFGADLMEDPTLGPSGGGVEVATRSNDQHEISGLMEASERAIKDKKLGSAMVNAVTQGLGAAGIDTASLVENTKGTLMSMLTLRQMDDQFSKLFGSETGNSMNDTTGAILKQGEHRSLQESNKLYSEWRTLDAKHGAEVMGKLNGIMTEATRNGFHPDAPLSATQNAHVKGDAKEQHAAWAKEFSALPADVKALYAKVRDYYDTQLKQQQTLLARNILMSYLDWSGSLQDAKAKFQALAGDLVSGAKKATEIEGVTPGGARALQSILNFSKVAGPYFPLRRFGDWVVRAGRDETKTFPDRAALDAFMVENPGVTVLDVSGNTLRYSQDVVEFYESLTEAKQASAAYKAEGFEATEPRKKRQYDQTDGKITNAAIKLTVANLKRNNQDLAPEKLAQVEKLLRDAAIMMMPETHIQKSMLKRRGVAGSDLNMQRSFSNYALASARYKSKLDFSPDIHDGMERMRAQRDTLASTEQIRASQVVEEIGKRLDADENSLHTPQWVDRLTQAGFSWYLLSPSYWMLNAAQPWMVGLPLLSAEHGVGKASGAMAKAMSTIGAGNILKKGLGSTAKGFIGKILPADFQLVSQVMDAVQNSNLPAARKDELSKMLTEVGDEGLIDLSFTMELSMGAAPGRTVAGRMFDAMRDLTSMMPHAVEIVNRSVMAVAAYNLARDAGKSHDVAVQKAKDAVAQSQFDYSIQNKARVFKLSPYLKPVLMFKQYALNMYVLMASNVAKSFSGATPEERRIARHSVLGLLMSHGLVAGATGMVFEPLKVAIGLVALALGDDQPWDVEEDIRQLATELFGPELGEVVSKGLPRAAGIDVSSRMGLQNLLTSGMPQAGAEASASSVYEWLGRTFGGPLASIPANFADGMKAFNQGDVYRGLQKVLPKGLKDVVGAMGLHEEGLTDTNGQVLRDADKFSPVELAAKVLGFQPASVAETYDRRSQIKLHDTEATTERNHLMERWYRAGSERPAVFQEIQEFNRENPAYRVTMGSLHKSLHERNKRQRSITESGVYLPKGRREMLKYGDAYNTD